jgi:hypothetical protein
MRLPGVDVMHRTLTHLFQQCRLGLLTVLLLRQLGSLHLGTS